MSPLVYLNAIKLILFICLLVWLFFNHTFLFLSYIFYLCVKSSSTLRLEWYIPCEKNRSFKSVFSETGIKYILSEGPRPSPWRLPAGTQYQNDVVSTSMRRDHVASTLTRRHFNVVCPLGLSCIYTLNFLSLFYNDSIIIWYSHFTIFFRICHFIIFVNLIIMCCCLSWSLSWHDRVSVIY